ncbi:MAG: outer membrane protein assembly factor BamA [Hyphomicrobiales bacterium]
MRSRVGFLCSLAVVFFLAFLAGMPVGARPALAQVVTSIQVEGNQRVEPETVRSYIQIQSGEAATPDRIDESIKALFQTGLFSDVQIYRQGTTLIVKVEENPLINIVSFEGNSEIDDKTLAKEVELKERTIFTRSRVQADVQRIIALYRRSGYYAARVEPQIIRLPQNRVNLVFEINEGKATKVASINFIGNEAFSDYTLRGVITTGEHAWWKFFSTSDNYDPDRLSYDKELLRRYYLKNGFADFRVVSATAELAPDGESFFITFTVEEGPQYSVGQVVINAGNTTIDPAQLQAAMTFGTGDTYDASKVDKSIENMTVEAGKAGFAFAKVQPDIQRDEAAQRLNVTFNIQEGPRVYIERIDIIGNTRTLDEVIRREIGLVEGDAYNRVIIDRARRRLTALDFFAKIDFREQPGSAPDKVVIIIEVEEKSTGTINFSAGYSTLEGVMGSVTVTERNFLGRGQQVSLNTSLSFIRQSLNFSFTEPYFLDRNVSAGFDAFITRTDQTDQSSYTLNQIGGALRMGFRLNDLARVTNRYSLQWRDTQVDNVNTNLPENDPRRCPNVAPAVCQANGTQVVSMFSSTFTIDDLDNPLKPTSGYRFTVTGDLAGLGGDVYFGRVDAAAYYFTPLYFDGVVLKLKGTAGAIEGWNGDQVSIQDRFYKGGTSFRGFAIAGIGPRQERPNSGGQTDAIGGQFYGIGTTEVTFPLGLPEELGLRGAAYMDVGTLFGAPEDNYDNVPECSGNVCNVYGKSAQLRLSAGVGLMWDSPFGPLRLDLAYPIIKQSYDQTQWFQFNVGTAF